MPKKRIPNINYCMVTIKGHQYYKAYVQNADEKTVIVCGKTIEELCKKVDDASIVQKWMPKPDALQR